MNPEQSNPGEAYANWKAGETLDKPEETMKPKHLYLVRENPLKGMSESDINEKIDQGIAEITQMSSRFEKVPMPTIKDEPDEELAGVFETKILQEQYKKEGRGFGGPSEDSKKTA